MAREKGEECHNDSIQMAESIDTVALQVSFLIKNPLSITIGCRNTSDLCNIRTRRAKGEEGGNAKSV